MNALKLKFVLAVCCLSLCGLYAKTKPVPSEKKVRQAAREMQAYLQTVQIQKDEAVKKYIAGLSAENRISQLFLVNIQGNGRFVPVERSGELYGRKGTGAYLVPGGCLFFSYNVADTPEKVMEFTDSIKEYSRSHGLVPPFIAIDQEGGTVNRLKSITGALPSCERVASSLEIEKAYRLYYLQGMQMKALGIDLNLAPVAEVCTDENREFLSGRSFGSLDAVIRYGRAAVHGYENSGVGTVLKHFPGNTNTDPHTGLPEIKLSSQELEQSVVYPFTVLASCGPSGILMSHARTEASDPDTPACLSPYWVTQVLRQKAGYRGIIFSDDIFMDALQKNGYPPDKAAIMAVEAGIDCIMLSEKRFAPVAHIIMQKEHTDAGFKDKTDAAVTRIIQWKIRQGILCLSQDSSGIWTVHAAPAAIAADRLTSRLERFKSARSENESLYKENFK